MKPVLIGQFTRDQDPEEFCMPILEARFGAQAHQIHHDHMTSTYGIYVVKDKAQAARRLLVELLNVYEKEEHGGGGSDPIPISREETGPEITAKLAAERAEQEKIAKAREKVIKLWALAILLREGNDRAMHDAGDLIDEYASQHATEHKIAYTSLQEVIARYDILSHIN